MTAARWPLGVLLTSWRYMWRTTPMHRHEIEGSLDEDRPPPLPPVIESEGIQSVSDGIGPMFHRLYRARIRESDHSPTEIIKQVQAEPDRVSPSEFATFQKTKGEERRMDVGDEYVVRMAGPWDGPVRVAEIRPRAFRLATLEGHLEAGQIEFRADHEGGEIIFEIESWARSKDRITDLLYNHLRISKEVQLHMWSSTLERIVELSGGRLTGGLDITTRTVEAGAIDG
jgi:hypothetical protein